MYFVHMYTTVRGTYRMVVVRAYVRKCLQYMYVYAIKLKSQLW